MSSKEASNMRIANRRYQNQAFTKCYASEKCELQDEMSDTQNSKVHWNREKHHLKANLFRKRNVSLQRKRYKNLM